MTDLPSLAEQIAWLRDLPGRAEDGNGCLYPVTYDLTMIRAVLATLEDGGEWRAKLAAQCGKTLAAAHMLRMIWSQLPPIYQATIDSFLANLDAAPPQDGAATGAPDPEWR